MIDKKINNFIDRVQQKTIEERQKMLFLSVIILGGLVLLIGVWNISSNLVSLDGGESLAMDDLEEVKKVSPTDFLLISLSNVWVSFKDDLREFNDSLGGDKEEIDFYE